MKNISAQHGYILHVRSRKQLHRSQQKYAYTIRSQIRHNPTIRNRDSNLHLRGTLLSRLRVLGCMGTTERLTVTDTARVMVCCASKPANGNILPPHATRHLVYIQHSERSSCPRRNKERRPLRSIIRHTRWRTHSMGGKYSRRPQPLNKQKYPPTRHPIHALLGDIFYAVPAGFEPADALTSIYSLAGSPIRPLWHDTLNAYKRKR